MNEWWLNDYALELIKSHEVQLNVIPREMKSHYSLVQEQSKGSESLRDNSANEISSEIEAEDDEYLAGVSRTSLIALLSPSALDWNLFVLVLGHLLLLILFQS